MGTGTWDPRGYGRRKRVFREKGQGEECLFRVLSVVKRGLRKIIGNGKRTYLQRVIVTREGVGICSWRLMNGEEETRIFSRTRKRRLLSEQGGAYAAPRTSRRSDSRSGEGKS